jgi:ligand-binding SRPBCC domain-containing protein
MKTFRHRFTVNSPLQKVSDFHRASKSMADITPFPVIVKIHQAPDLLEEGSVIDFTMWIGLLPVHWIAKIENIGENSFTDRQIHGPFTEWLHQHKFTEVAEGLTEVEDTVQASSKKHWVWWMIGSIMWLTLPLLFTYRAWKTNHLLQ